MGFCPGKVQYIPERPNLGIFLLKSCLSKETHRRESGSCSLLRGHLSLKTGCSLRKRLALGQRMTPEWRQIPEKKPDWKPRTAEFYLTISTYIELRRSGFQSNCAALSTHLVKSCPIFVCCRPSCSTEQETCTLLLLHSPLNLHSPVLLHSRQRVC